MKNDQYSLIEEIEKEIEVEELAEILNKTIFKYASFSLKDEDDAHLETSNHIYYLNFIRDELIKHQKSKLQRAS